MNEEYLEEINEVAAEGFLGDEELERLALTVQCMCSRVKLDVIVGGED